jgi:hypothetical protein
MRLSRGRLPPRERPTVAAPLLVTGCLLPFCACRRLMTIPSVGQPLSLLSPQSTIPPAFADPETSTPIWAWSPVGISRAMSTHRRHLEMWGQAGADAPVRSRHVMLTRYKGQLKLKDWAFAIASDQRCAKRESLWPAASRSSCTRCYETEPSSHQPKLLQPRQEAESSSQEERRPRKGANDGADSVAWVNSWPTAISTKPPCTQLTPSSERRHPQSVDTQKSLSPLMMWTSDNRGRRVIHR